MKTKKLRRRQLLTLAAAATVALAFAPRVGLAGPAQSALPSPSDPDFARKIMERVDDMYRGSSSHGIMAMTVKTQHWTRNMEMESWSLGEDYSLVRILEPKKERGTATLKAKDDLFTYLNKTSRTIKITGAMMGASWMGSHFTNDDLVKGSRYSDDYTLRHDRDDRSPNYHFTLTPKPKAAVVWGKVTVLVRKSDLQPLEQTFYDEDGAAVRQLAFSEFRTVGDKVIPTKMVMKPLDGSGEYTQMLWKRLSYDVKLDRGFFSLQRLKSM